MRVDYPQKNGSGEVTNASGQVELVADTPGSVMYLFMEKLTISVYKAATGGGGTVQVKETDGTVIWETDADTPKDFSLDWGSDGLLIGQDSGIQVITANASTAQASAWVGFKGHLSFQDKT